MSYPVPWKQPRAPRVSHHDRHHHAGSVMLLGVAWAVLWFVWATFAMFWYLLVGVYLIYKWVLVGMYLACKAGVVWAIAKWADRRTEPEAAQH